VGKDMRVKNIGNHNLRSCGYLEKSSKWKKQDDQLEVTGGKKAFNPGL
jgi:hypothetical protein